jgi:hypothetical protein
MGSLTIVVFIVIVSIDPNDDGWYGVMECIVYACMHAYKSQPVSLTKSCTLPMYRLIPTIMLKNLRIILFPYSRSSYLLFLTLMPYYILYHVPIIPI